MGSGVQHWDDGRLGTASLEAIISLHQPAERFRISQGRYPAGTVFSGGARAGRRYVLAGACAFTFGATTWELRAGDIADLPEGTFWFRVLGNGPVELVSVWELPPGFWGRGDA